MIIFWKATEQYFHVMLWFLHFWCLDHNMQCEHSLESLLLNSTVCFVIDCGNLQPVQTVLSAVAVFSSLSLFTN